MAFLYGDDMKCVKCRCEMIQKQHDEEHFYYVCEQCGSERGRENEYTEVKTEPMAEPKFNIDNEFK